MDFGKRFCMLFTGFASLGVLVAPAVGQAPAPAPFMVHQLKPDVYWVEGGGGNSGVIIGDKGVVVVDAKTTPAGGKELLEDIAKITPKPVTTVILTHSDGDHVNGLASFPAGITIIARRTTKRNRKRRLPRAAGARRPPITCPPKWSRRTKRTIKSMASKWSCCIGRPRIPAATW